MTMTIEPAPDPDFVDPPQDQDLDCGGVNDPPSFILVSNGLTGPCGVNINAPLVSVTQNGGTLYQQMGIYTSMYRTGIHAHTKDIYHHCTQFVCTGPRY